MNECYSDRECELFVFRVNGVEHRRSPFVLQRDWEKALKAAGEDGDSLLEEINLARADEFTSVFAGGDPEAIRAMVSSPRYKEVSEISDSACERLAATLYGPFRLASFNQDTGEGVDPLTIVGLFSDWLEWRAREKKAGGFWPASSLPTDGPPKASEVPPA